MTACWLLIICPNRVRRPRPFSDNHFLEHPLVRATACVAWVRGVDRPGHSMDRIQSARGVAAAKAKERLDAAIAFKNRWHNWLYNNPPNITLLVSNVLYLALS